jgi:hypothetical protein
MAGFAADLAKKETQVKVWLAEVSSGCCSGFEAPKKPATPPNDFATETDTQPTIASIPANIKRMYGAKRPLAWGYVCRDNCKLPMCGYFFLFSLT